MKLTPIRVWLPAALLGLLSASMLLVQTVHAQCLTEGQDGFCSASDAYVLVGAVSAISGRSSALDADTPAVEDVQLPTAGALIYTDYVELEERARTLLTKALRMRESISPYRDDNDFENHLRRLDFKAGWENQPYGGLKPGYESASTFAELVAEIEADLIEARNLYAFLAVFAPEARFRMDSAYIAEGAVPLCGAEDKEDPNPQSTPGEPTVEPPVIDWCNFQARLRQSVREAANVRMIVGQEFMVDALGVNFSEKTVGGEELVRNEVAQLRAARYQFERAEDFLADGLQIAVGNGCLISDFYSESEWRLLGQAAARQGTAQFHIAARESYLNVGGPQGFARAQTVAQDTLRRSTNDGHLKLIGLAGLGAPVEQQCQIGGRPDAAAFADVLFNQLETIRRSREMAAGLNVFGFDVTMTPARTYISSSPRNCDTLAQGDRGLWDQAWCSARLAEGLQKREEEKTRLYDTSQEKLNEALDTIRQGLDLEIFNTSSCEYAGIDDVFFACVQTQADAFEECLRLAAVAPEIDARTVIPSARYPSFEACMVPASAGGIINDRNDIYTALLELRSDYLAFQSIQTSAINVNKQIQNSNDANAIVTKWLGKAGAAETAARVSETALATFACISGPLDQFLSGGSQAAGCIALGALNATLQGTAGALSTQAEVEIANAENTKEIKNLLLQMSELVIDAQSARQAFLAQQSDVGGAIDLLRRNLNETQRQRAYFATSPANDPSFRIVRDSGRIELAAALETAARLSYLAARRAEYEYAARLADSSFAISDIYRARTAQDILTYLATLQGITNGLPGSAERETIEADLKISVAQDILLLTDDSLRSQGFTTQEAIAAERTRRFRAWVAENTVPNDFTAPKDGKPVLRFSFASSLLSDGLFANVIGQGYSTRWLLKLSAIDSPKKGNNGVSINLVSEEVNLSHRTVTMSQGGILHMRRFDGCIFNYRQLALAKLLGYDWPEEQDAEAVTATFTANVNDSNAYTESNFRTSAFEGQAVSATDWEITIFAGRPGESSGLPDMDLQRLTDIELRFSIVYASRGDDPPGGPPSVDNCARVDY